MTIKEDAHRVVEYTDKNGNLVGTIAFNEHDNSVAEMNIRMSKVFGTSPEYIDTIEEFLQVAKKQKWTWRNAKPTWGLE